MIADFAGTVLLVSHDRDFLDRTVTATIFAEGGGRFIEYAGGYSDMLAQRGEGVIASSAPKPVRTEAKPKERKRERKMSFADKHALETLPKKIEALEREIASLQKELADPDLYARDAARFRTFSEILSAREAERAAAEDRWLELELLKEELEG
jgi:ATP-binding cassette subfamily F protein uup